MSKLHLKHLKNRLEEIYSNSIDLTDVTDKSLEERNKRLLTRALAAYSIQALGAIDSSVAAKSVVDGYEDNGLDAIHYDIKNKTLWIVQSKWYNNTDSTPESGEIAKFVKGINDLLDLKLERFNDKVKEKEEEIIEALNEPLIKIKVVIAYTGNDSISVHAERYLADLLTYLNNPSEIATYHIFALKHAHQALVGTLANSPINVDLILSNWGINEDPYKSVYGVINAADIAEIWKSNKGKLFNENIRDFLGVSDVNEDIIDTIKDEPQNFYYFNNGVTALCSRVSKKPIGGNDRIIGYFIAEDFKIVNGAQTVGSIGSAYELFPDKVSTIKILIKLISLENCPEHFGLRVTKATNTQNKIEKKDFVSLDPEQERIKTEFALEGINYHYKRSDNHIPCDDKNCTIEEATIALACMSEDVTLAAQVKREIGKIWNDIEAAPYKDLFNASTKSYVIWRGILTMRKVNKVLKQKENSSTGRQKSHYIHSNRFILHMILRTIPKNHILNPVFQFENYLSNFIPSEIDKLSEQLRLKVDELYPEDAIYQVYKNITKTKELKNIIINWPQHTI